MGTRSNRASLGAGTDVIINEGHKQNRIRSRQPLLQFTYSSHPCRPAARLPYKNPRKAVRSTSKLENLVRATFRLFHATLCSPCSQTGPSVVTKCMCELVRDSTIAAL
jgi:hypothetical protein